MFNNVKLGIAPIGWTNDDMPQLGGELTFEQMVSEAALAGFQGTEVGGKFPTNPAVLNKALDLRGIKIASQWFSSFLCSTPYEENEKAFIEQLDFLEAVGASRINVCELTRCLFAEETKRLMDNTDPRYVYLCFDTGHFTFSKEDAVKAAKEFGPRIGHVHLKDIRPDMMEKAYAEGFKFRKAVLEGCFTIPGDGCVDYPGVFKALHDAHYEGWFIVEAEQDPAKANPLEYAKMAREYIKKTAGI